MWSVPVLYCRINSVTSGERILLAVFKKKKKVLLIVWVAFLSLLGSARNHTVLFLKPLKADSNLSVTVQ